MPSESRAHGRRPPVLPANRSRQRPTRLSVPGQHRLALIGQGDRIRGGARRREGGLTSSEHRRQQVLGIHLDRFTRGVLADGHLAGPEHVLPGTDEERLRRGCSLVNRQDVHAVEPPDDDVYASSASCPWAPSSVRMAAGSSSHWTA